MVEALRFIDGKLHHFLRPWGQTDFTRHEVIPTANNAFDGLTSPFEIDPQASEHVAGHAFPLAKQAKQKMLGADVVVVEALRLFLGKTHGMPGPLGEPVKTPPPVLACTSSRSAGTSPAVTRQVSHDGVNNSLYCH